MKESLATIADWLLHNPQYRCLPLIIVGMCAAAFVFITKWIIKKNEKRFLNEDEKAIFVASLAFLESKEEEMQEIQKKGKLIMAILTEITPEEKEAMIASMPDGMTKEEAGKYFIKTMCEVFERPYNGASGYFRLQPNWRITYNKIWEYLD